MGPIHCTLGGLDSSLIAALAMNLMREEGKNYLLQTFAIGMQGSPDLEAAARVGMILLKDKYPNFEVGLKCILMVNPYLLVCSYIK